MFTTTTTTTKYKTRKQKVATKLVVCCPQCNLIFEQVPKAMSEKEQPIEILRDYIAGVGYSDYQKVLPKLKAGHKLDLVWERKNKFDPNAIRVDFEGTKLGYISKKDNQKIHQYREGGAKVTCELTAVNHGNPSHTLLCVSVKVSTEPSSQTITQGDQKISG